MKASLSDIEAEAQFAGCILSDVVHLATHLSHNCSDDADAASAGLRLISMACEKAHRHAGSIEMTVMQLQKEAKS